MQPRKFCILSAITAASLALTVAAITASSGTSHADTHAALTAQTESSPPVNLDNCPILYAGYPRGGCVAQLQTELNTILGLNLHADGIFGLATKSAVERFQQEHNIVPADGIVGPLTKAALDNPGSSSAWTPLGQLNPGQQITSGTQIASPDGRFVLQMQSDGNLVIRAPGNIPVGDTHTAGHDGTIAVMQTDGNFVLRAPGNIPVWASGTEGHPGTVLQVQDDGGVLLYAPGHQVLRVIFPAFHDPQSSEPTPAVPPATQPVPPATQPGPPATQPGPPATQPAPDDGLVLGAATKNCGWATCSYYLTRYDTKLLDSFLSKHDWQQHLADVAVCGAIGWATDGVGAAYCGATWFVVVEQTQRAAHDHGAQGACLKLTYIPSTPDSPPIPLYWSTNNGKYCHD